MVIDFWHLWAGGQTKPEEVAAFPLYPPSTESISVTGLNTGSR